MSGTSPHSPLRLWWTQRPPAAGAAVMATGIISVGLHLSGHETLSRVTLVLACAAWLGLAAEFVSRLLRERARWVADAGTPGALTAVAATTVLGTGLSVLGRQTLAEALLALSALLWPPLIVLVVGHWKRRMPGGVFLCCVATQGLAVLGATLAAAESAAWLAHTALVLFWLGLVLYGVALFHFDLRQVLRGPGDQWIAGGALAISALAGSKLIAADSARLYLWNDDDRRPARGDRRPAGARPGLVRRPAGGRVRKAPPSLRRAPLGHRVPHGDDGGRDPVRRRRRGHPVAEDTRRGAAVDLRDGLAGRRGGRGRLRPCRPQVHSTAMKTLAVVSAPTRPNRLLSTFSSSRFT
ncbi:hypothetical protein M2162_003341 [Streptomyces sp. SAI-041]|nr:hypothetical protein [Streptomyces sp. SAI-041]